MKLSSDFEVITVRTETFINHIDNPIVFRNGVPTRLPPFFSPDVCRFISSIHNVYDQENEIIMSEIEKQVRIRREDEILRERIRREERFWREKKRREQEKIRRDVNLKKQEEQERIAREKELKFIGTTEEELNQEIKRLKNKAKYKNSEEKYLRKLAIHLLRFKIRNKNIKIKKVMGNNMKNARLFEDLILFLF